MASSLNNSLDALSEARATNSQSGVGIAATEAIAKANILIVDDREDKRMAIEIVIADLNQNIFMASSGREALRLLLKHDFAVILLDVNMPGMDGFETAQLIRQRARLENVPIIFISAVSDTETHLSRGYSMGAVDYILAPIIPAILRTKVAVFVELFKATDQIKRQADELRRAHRELEERVLLRTGELAKANESLQMEIKERHRAERDLLELNTQLENRVDDRTRELQSANQELETFAYSIAHDLRAPCRQIHGYSEILDEEFSSVLPSEAREYLSRIVTKSKEMEQMVDDLLSLFVISKQSFDCQKVDLNLVVREILASLKHDLTHRNIDWVIGTLPNVNCSFGLVKQVFENLISNALKYTRPRTKAQIEIGTSQIIGNIEDVIFIRDNGVGFDMQYATRLFGVFQRLHHPDQFEGNGIGLALVERIVQKHGGRIWAEAKPEEGATFYFTLQKVSNESQ